MKLTLRDEKILAVLAYFVCSLSHLSDAFFTSRKKAAERMKKLYDAELVRRIPRPFVDSLGKAEFVYSLRPIRDVYSVPHSLLVSDVRFSFLLSSPSGFRSDFYHPKQLMISAGGLCGLIPDGVIVVESLLSGKKIVHFLEADCGSEMLRSKRYEYSLEHKIEKYLSLFDDAGALRRVGGVLGFSMRGFRVLLVGKGEKRLGGIKRVCSDLGAEFVWCTLHDEVVREGVYSPVWSNCLYGELSLIKPYPGTVRGGDLEGDLGRDLDGDAVPMKD